MADPPVGTGQIIDGKYRIDRVLGRGAMGIVVAASHVTLERPVALKFMLANGKMTEELQERFFLEARLAGKLQSQHAAKVLDVGMLDGTAPYIVMEFLDGRDLAALLKERGPFSVEEAVTYILQASEAVAEAHALGIVHRDIKPANLFLSRGADGSPCIKLVDFGVAKLADGGMDLTSTEQQLGSPLYMSPEAINASREVDCRTDIWALGICLYELLAKITPFQADTLMALCSGIFFAAPVPIERYRSDVPPGLAAVILQCLEKDRTRRWPSVAAFAAALAPFASVRPTSYAERVARVQGTGIAPARSTERLPAPSAQALADARAAEERDRVAEQLGGPGTGAAGGGEHVAGTHGAVVYPLRSRPDAAPLAVSARTSAANTGGVVSDGRLRRRIAIGVPIVVAAAAMAIVLVRAALREPQPAANPVVVPAATRETPSPTPEPTVSKEVQTGALAGPTPGPTASAAVPPPSSAAVVGSAAARPKPTPHHPPAQPTARQTDLPEGPRR